MPSTLDETYAGEMSTQEALGRVLGKVPALLAEMDVADICVLIIDRPSDTIMPDPMLQRNGLSWRWLVPMFEPVCTTVFMFQPT